MANLSFKNINKIYPGGFQAVYDFNLEVSHGEFIVLVGPSGCGKSTTLRMIAGLETISNGELLFNDKCVNNVAPSDRDIAMVFQNYALYGNMSVYENMGFSLAVRHIKDTVIHEKVMKAADVVDMKTQLNKKPKNISGGQRQRVALGRTIVRDASVFLLDEPLSNLDAKLRIQTRKELTELHQKLNATFIYVTHDQDEAMTMATRIVIMDHGVIQQVGTPSEVYNYPNNVFVGGFIGSPAMNFMNGKIENGYFINDNFTIKLEGDQLTKMSPYENKEVIIGIRPEHFRFGSNSNSDVVGERDVVEFLGAEYLISFKLGGNVFKAKVKSNEVNVDIEDSIYLNVEMEKVHFFDNDTKLRIE